MSTRSALRCAATTALVSAAVLLAAAGTASAHVTIDASTVAAKGGFATVTLNVPNERPDASTVKVSVQLPQDQAIPFASVQPKPGWTVETTTRKLDAPIADEGESIDEVVDTITWTADGDGIGPGQFDQFRISMGPLPTDVDELTLPAVQTYDSGDEVRWIETGADADLPAPRLVLSAATGDSHHDEEATTTEPAAAAASDDDGSGNALAVIALVIAVVALLGAGASVLGSRRRTTA